MGFRFDATSRADYPRRAPRAAPAMLPRRERPGGVTMARLGTSPRATIGIAGVKRYWRPARPRPENNFARTEPQAKRTTSQSNSRFPGF
jgi:hypothetical protein